jgi:hypothetical protein
MLVMIATLGEVYLRGSAPAAVALSFARHDGTVQTAVGEVEHARLNWIGHIHYEGSDGWASFEVRVTGARTTGTLDVILQRQRGIWNVAGGHLVTDSGRALAIVIPVSPMEQARAVN